MEKNSLLEKIWHHLEVSYTPIFILFSIAITSCGKKDEPLTVAISPYQDIAMIVNIENLGLEEKYSTNVKLLTMNWEEILPAIASAGKTADIGFGSLTEYLTKSNNLNNNSSDPILFIYPAYIFKGGGFVTFKESVPIIYRSDVQNDSIVTHFFSHKIGAQKNSVYEMMLYSLAKRNGIDTKSLEIFDIPLNEGVLATQSGSMDISAAGLTQISEALKNNGKVVLTMDELGFADITGFICKKSTLESKREQITNLLYMWFECVDFVFSDIDNNSKFSLEYLNQKAATKYTLNQYKEALSQEYFPLGIKEANDSILSVDGIYSYKRISQDITDYLMVNGIIKNEPSLPDFIYLQ